MKPGDAIQEQLFKKLKDWLVIISEMERIEKEKPNLTEDELLEDEEYGKLLDKSGKLRKEVNSLFIQTKLFPLVGLEGKQPEVLDTIYKWLSESGSIEQKHIEHFLEVSFENFHSDFVRRAKQVEPVFLTRHLDFRTDRLYHEVINCYIYGAFEASCVLCRAITETMAKRFIELKGYSWLLEGKAELRRISHISKNDLSLLKEITNLCIKIDNKLDSMLSNNDEKESRESILKEIQFLLIKMAKLTKPKSVPDILKNELMIDDKILSLYTRIGNKADNILHESKEIAKEEDALEAIRLLQSFLNKFPKI